MRTLEYSEGCDTTMPHPIKKNVKSNMIRLTYPI